MTKIYENVEINTKLKNVLTEKKENEYINNEHSQYNSIISKRNEKQLT